MQSFSTSLHGPAYERLRERFRAARIEIGLTQERVASFLGKPQSFISKIEVGDRRVNFIEMQIFASVYGEPLSYFEDDELAEIAMGS